MSDLDHYIKMKEEVKKEVMIEINETLSALMEGQDNINKLLFAMQTDIKPMVSIFKNATGFNQVVILGVKILAGFALLIGSLYTILQFFKKIGS